ncbi:SDR family oxidoreductase [Streptomyces sp. MBT62]|uniref:SDR family oxidoreductase n=1 Tax=Streptomyces sp. MBT62 TaxID=2800410 RepID=UPI00190D21DB|nr:SDR family oxidoreductase [Streptomyces sp. MBT62]MBK3562591.1 mycofactocin-coupled SDR family oxidoreductase [Streptomyces sp. MBT62]
MSLEGKTVVITGAARGLGRECAVRFADEGADLALLDIAGDLDGIGYPLGSRSQLDHTAELCEQRGSAVAVAAVDVRDEAQVEAAVREALARFHTIDVLVNNAGIAAPSGVVLHEISEPDWSLMLDVDLSGTWRMIKAVAPAMVGQKSGSIINVSSTAGLVGYRNFSGYVTAKHGLIGLTKAAALDYAPHRVRVNALCPGSVRDNPLVEGRMLAEIARALDVPAGEYEDIFLRDQPMNALIESSDIAGAATWLAGDDSRQVTGSVITVDGGFTSR